MKIKYIILLLLTVGFFGSCELDVNPKNIVQDELVFSSESGIRAYFVTLYSDLPVEDFKFGKNGFNASGNQTYLAFVSGEAIAKDDISNIGDGTWWGAWDYGRIRRVNYFIQTLPKYKDKYSEDKYNAWMGEAYFIRAYCYFSMVKRYGGVPILKEPQVWTGDVNALKVPRNTEKDCYDFIAEDLDLAADLMEKGKTILSDASYSGRANEYIAYALKSRAMLYAGSIARYGSVNLNGLVGIESQYADHYFTLAFEAAEKVVSSGKYSLYRGNTNKEKNFAELFLADNSSENIFVKSYKLNVNAHSWDIYCVPYQYRGTGYSSSINPTLDLAELFEYQDGSGVNITQKAQTMRFDKPTDIFSGLDARFGGSIIYPNSTFKGTTCTLQKGLIVEDGSKKESANSDTVTYRAQNGKTYRVVGESGVGKYSGNMTGFVIRKYLNESQTEMRENYSTQHWIDFRLAEIYLNGAEAAAELNNATDQSEALVWMNDLRDRAGLKNWSSSELTIDNVRKERRVELAFENHAYWDLRRWHLADKIFETTRLRSLFLYQDVRDDKYVFEVGYPNSYYYTFDVKMYYEKIPDSEISKNGLLVQNPYYN